MEDLEEEFSAPVLSAELLEFLEEQYPDKMVTDDIDEHERLILAGKILLIREIRNLIEDK